MPARPVDAAMAADRPAKRRVREMWIERVVEALPRFDNADVPLYLTLCGAEGREIALLLERGVLTRTEVGSISPDDGAKVIAIEASPKAEVELRRRFPGLKVLRQAIQDVLKSSNPRAWPTPDEESCCRAFVVNLDLDEPLKCVIDHGQITFPVVLLVEKLAEIHSRNPIINWALFLTLHGEVVGWDDSICDGIRDFLLENFSRETSFEAHAAALMGKALIGDLKARKRISWKERPVPDQQHLLMTLVPKKIAQVVHARGWLVETVANYRYGGTADHAPMVTWGMEFRWDARASITPDAVYRESLASILKVVGSIEENGTIS